MNQAKQIPRLIMNTLIVIAAALGTVACVTTAFGLTVNYGVIVLVCTLSALLFTSCFLWKPFLWLLLILAVTGAYLIFATDMFAPVAPTFTQLVHDILTRFFQLLTQFQLCGFLRLPEAYLPQDLTLLFSLMAILLSVWMAWGVGYRSCLISVAGTLPFLLLCVVINDTPPHVIPLVLLLSAWLTVLLCKERPEEPASMDAARLGITLMAVLLLLSIVGTVYPKEDTHNRELPDLVQNFLDQLPGPLQNMLSRDSHGVQNEELGADTSETLDLTTQGTRDRKDTVMMQLSSTQTGVLYLRGAAKDVYTGSSWESRNEAGAEESVYAQTSLGTAFGGSTQAAVQIRNYQDHATVAFVPYGFINCTGAEPITSDLRILCAADDYINYYWPDLAGLDLTSPTGIVNADYDAYVQETCLELPESTQNALYNLALQYGYDPSLSTLDTIAWVAEFVRTVGSYQLNVSRQPINHDFAVYFLTESKAGYCVHFATAAATMYRALGIPAGMPPVTGSPFWKPAASPMSLTRIPMHGRRSISAVWAGFLWRLHQALAPRCLCRRWSTNPPLSRRHRPLKNLPNPLPLLRPPGPLPNRLLSLPQRIPTGPPPPRLRSLAAIRLPGDRRICFGSIYSPPLPLLCSCF